MNRNGQTSFDSVEDAYCKELTDDMITELKRSLKQVNLETFTFALYTCIIFNIALPRNKDDEDYVENTKHP